MRVAVLKLLVGMWWVWERLELIMRIINTHNMVECLALVLFFSISMITYSMVKRSTFMHVVYERQLVPSIG